MDSSVIKSGSAGTVSQNSGAVSGSSSRGSGGDANRMGINTINNPQRTAQRKVQARNYPRNKKLEKLAVYSSCKVSQNSEF